MALHKKKKTEIQDCLNYFSHSFDLFSQFLTEDNFFKVRSAAIILANTLRSQKKIISAGNGGSLQDAGHFAEELTGRFYKNRPALAAIVINDPGHITCVANDYGYDYVFSKYIEAHGKQGDTFVGFTTSGNSKNIIEALKAARKARMNTLVLTGGNGGEIVKDKLATHVIAVPSTNSGNAQETHIKIVHCLIYLIEKELGFETLSL